jgi:hypothetical protein
MACPMCTGTDCADACNHGQCYAEEMQREQSAEAEYWQQRFDVEESARIITALAPVEDDEDYEPEPGDGCLCCGAVGPCGCDAAYEDSRYD